MTRSQAIALLALRAVLSANGGVPVPSHIWRAQSGLREGQFTPSATWLRNCGLIRMTTVEPPALYDLTPQGVEAIKRALAAGKEAA